MHLYIGRIAMTHKEVVDEFVKLLLEAPEFTMTAVALRLSATDYELKLLHADPLKQHYVEAERQEQFPFATAEKGGQW